MASASRTHAAIAQPAVDRAGATTFEWAYAALCCYLAAGFYLDAWAHNNRGDLESFFTPWHGVLYSAYFALASFMVGTVSWRHARGVAWHNALPRGYNIGLLGAGVFLAGGFGDMFWHTAFGFEVGVEALLSPSHIGLATGVFLMVAAPLRAWAVRTGPTLPGFFAALPLLLSLTFIWSVLTYLTAYAHPLVSTSPAIDFRPESFPQQAISLDVAGILLQSALMVSVLLLALRRWHLPPGAIAFMLSLNAILTIYSAPRSDTNAPVPLIAAMLTAAITADVAYALLRPSMQHTHAMRAFTFAVPVITTSFYFLVLELAGGIWWSVHVWSGAIVLAGGMGLLVSFLVVPPRGLAEQT